MEDGKGGTFLETLIKYGNAIKDGASSSQHSLFGEDSGAEIPAPVIPEAEEWPTSRKLNLEKEVVGIFISGHPLDDYKLDIQSFCTPGGISNLKELERNMGREMRFAGIISEAAHKIGKNNNPYGIFNLEDYEDNSRFFLFGDDYARFKHLIENGWFLLLTGKVQMRRRDGKEEPEFKVTQLELLSEVRAKKTKDLKLKIQLEDLNDALVTKIADVVSSHRGNCKLNIEIVDGDSQLVMHSKSILVSPDQDLIHDLQLIPELELSLGT
jgi:DNA polymerase-3 subunit alpha